MKLKSRFTYVSQYTSRTPVLSLSLAVLALAFVIYLLGLLSGEEEPSAPSGEVMGRIVNISQKNHNEKQLVIDQLSQDGVELEYKVITSVSKYADFQLYQGCSLRGRFKVPENFDTFDYKRYLANQGIYFVLSSPDVDCQYGVLSIVESIHLNLLEFKAEMIKDIESEFHEPHASLLVGIMFGEDRVFLEEFSSYLKVSGTTHIVSASGYNLAVQ